MTDIPSLLWRERWLMGATFLAVAALGVGVALTLKPTYQAHSSVLVSLGQEYVYEPRAGDAARGAVPDSDHMLASEAEILNSDALHADVVRRIGVARLAPAEAHAYAVASPEQRELMIAKLADGVGRALKVDTAPANPVIRLTYQSADPQLAALVLNDLLDDYLIFRRTVLMPSAAGALDDQRRAFEQRLAAADAAYQTFLTGNQIGDFDADKTALSQLSAQVEQQQYANDASLREKSGRLATIDAELAGLAPEIGLYHDSDPTASAKLAALKVQREDLLSRYKPDAQPVQEIDAQIAQLQTAIDAGRTAANGPERTGLNPVYQTFETEKLQLDAEVAALKATGAEFADQMAKLTDRRLRLAQLEPQNDSLSLDRDVLQTNIKDFAAKADESEASQAMAQSDSDNIRIVERASAPTSGRSLRSAVAALALMFAGFTALCAGLVRMFLRPGLPTPASAARTLDLPVLGSAPLKQPA
ncbi:MAG TPA: Wzz/FepE/Etk N-terminal domain-containing protein [Caulobacteraceae bacterium]